MSNLWVNAARYQREAMAWQEDPRDRRKYTPVHVKQAGFAGVVGDHEDDEELRHETGQARPEDHFDEDLWDESSPEPTSHEQAHYEEHYEYPDSYEERHGQAYDEAKQRKDEEAKKSPYDHEDPGLRHFVDQHVQNTELWHNHGRTGKVSLRQPVYATQTHVAREHLDKYKADPGAITHHLIQYPQAAHFGYLGNEHPMFVTHQGRLHTVEGHHRVGAALEEGKPHIFGHHFNLDEHPDLEHLNEDEVEDY